MNQNPRYKEKNSRSSATGNQFIPTPVRAHRHTGQDSLQVDYNSLLNKPSGGAAIYSGYVVSGGTAGTPFPARWTVTSVGTGGYQVTHNLGTTNYIVVATPLIFSVLTRIVNIFAVTSNSFEFQIFDASGSSQDIGVFFILTTQANP